MFCLGAAPSDMRTCIQDRVGRKKTQDSVKKIRDGLRLMYHTVWTAYTARIHKTKNDLNNRLQAECGLTVSDLKKEYWARRSE